ncbi:MAG: glycine cleavage system aminomethyltransferase GcvT [Thaumarchaeota archaeon]|nr:glycine cleavage system aminomethyltransferase GcvT [Nitrososphaerota archaeon]
MQSLDVIAGTLLKRIHLNDLHTLHGTMGEFGGFSLPIFYQGISEEHLAVRERAGLFDISHMGRLSLKGEDATSFLDSILPSDVDSCKDGKAFYSFLLNKGGGILDDIVVMKKEKNDYIIVVNASNIDKDSRWMMDHSRKREITLTDTSSRSAMFALQGPKAQSILEQLTSANLSELKRFEFIETEVRGITLLLSRTGYTGEDGFEMIIESPIQDPKRAIDLWEKIMSAGKAEGLIPCGLGARDTLRLEAGLCLYGSDIDESVTPLEADLSRFICMEKQFLGKESLSLQEERGVKKMRRGLSMLSAGIPRHNHEIFINNRLVGRVTSGTYSPLLKKGIAMGYIDNTTSGNEDIEILIRDTKKAAELVKPPFYDPKIYGARRLR